MQDQNLTSAPARSLSFGEQLVGVTFNPSNDDKVSKLKSLFAEIANIVQDEHLTHQEHYTRSILFNHTVGEILNAQMNCVKLVTLKC
jgi:hypothetical protein